MNNEFIIIKEGLMTDPSFIHINKILIEKVSNIILPFSVGVEIECQLEEDFPYIPNIIKRDFNKHGEIRFRIPSGLIGLQCLYEVSQNLIKFANFNPDSGIHYHVDCSDWIKLFDNNKFDNEIILKELDTWEYGGDYNARKICNHKGGWIGKRESYGTLEFRCGNMTFDYKELIKRIEHACRLVIKMKFLCTNYISQTDLDNTILLLKEEYKNIIEPIENEESVDDIRNIIKNR